MVEQFSWQAVPVQAYPVIQTQELIETVPLVLLMLEQFRTQSDPDQV